MRLVNLGFPKSGTTSLNKFLSDTGFSPAHWRLDPETKKSTSDAFVGELVYSNYFSGKPIFQGFKADALTQLDVCIPRLGLNFWPQLDPNIRRLIRSEYPECFIILLKRKPADVICSIKKWNNMHLRIVASDIPGLPCWSGYTEEDLFIWIQNHY